MSTGGLTDAALIKQATEGVVEVMIRGARYSGNSPEDSGKRAMAGEILRLRSELVIQRTLIERLKGSGRH